MRAIAPGKSPAGEPGSPTRTITAPDGSQIHYLYLPNIGESYQRSSAVTGEHHQKSSAAAPTPTVAPESLSERIMSAARFAVERAGMFGHAAVQALVLDDWKALTDVHSASLQSLEAAADLASWAIPEGKIAEIAGHALAKVAEEAAAHLAAAGVKQTAEHATAAAEIGKLWAARSENAKIAEQHAMNSSKIWDRPLTEAERQGRFENGHDLTAFLGPATERGGP